MKYAMVIEFEVGTSVEAEQVASDVVCDVDYAVSDHGRSHIEFELAFVAEAERVTIRLGA